MVATKHFTDRRNQRGLRKSLTRFVVDYGERQGDKHVVSKKDAQRIVDHLNHLKKIALEIAKKGGAVVISEDEALITCYRKNR